MHLPVPLWLFLLIKRVLSHVLLLVVQGGFRACKLPRVVGTLVPVVGARFLRI